MQNKIFTFWEPKDTIPPYLELCIESWRKYLPDYEIIILNYSNLFEWIDKNTFDEILYTDFSLPLQSDAIRCAVLKKYGGIWFDADTIVTSNKINNILNKNSDIALIGTHIAFIKANKNCAILNKWFEEINIKIAKYRDFKKNYDNMSFVKKILNNKNLKKYKNWNYLGNSIINKLIKDNTYKKTIIEKYNSKAFHEINWAKINNKNLKLSKIYRHFYFKNDFSSFALDNNYGIICLHNSWTPIEIKKMNKKKFFKSKNTLSEILRKILQQGEI